ncbi:MAG: threonine synthase [Acidobacteria bacterium]|nr:threonine synthase [Acidobacteriota bacterium]
MKHITRLRCVKCYKNYTLEQQYTCLVCGLEGILDIEYDYELVRKTLNKTSLAERELNHWRYRELLPISESVVLPYLQVGWTPVYQSSKVAQIIDIKDIYIKDDGRNPTASFKDRASSVGVVKAIEQGAKIIACASTGNAASSLAGFSAAVGLKSIIFVPERAPEPKITQLLIFGATVIRVQGSYEDAWWFCQKACERWGWYNRNAAVNPYLVEGKKSAGLEIAEQMADKMPDWVVFSVGDGCTIAGAWKGILEMYKIGIISRLPRILGVQAIGASPIVKAFRSQTDLVISDAQTIADSICVGEPRNWRKAVKAIQDSNGEMIEVTDEEILEAMRLAARSAAVFGEPAGVAALAGLKRAREAGIVRAKESALVAITGNGLKDVQTARQAAGSPISLEPNMDKLEKILDEQHLL